MELLTKLLTKPKLLLPRMASRELVLLVLCRALPLSASTGKIEVMLELMIVLELELELVLR
jgi:hypothetical protein